jgi:hypothetical protein
MTKTEMVNFIESTGMVIDFDRKWLMRKTKQYIENLYRQAVEYSGKK